MLSSIRPRLHNCRSKSPPYAAASLGDRKSCMNKDRCGGSPEEALRAISPPAAAVRCRLHIRRNRRPHWQGRRGQPLGWAQKSSKHQPASDAYPGRSAETPNRHTSHQRCPHGHVSAHMLNEVEEQIDTPPQIQLSCILLFAPHAAKVGERNAAAAFWSSSNWIFYN